MSKMLILTAVAGCASIASAQQLAATAVSPFTLSGFQAQARPATTGETVSTGIAVFGPGGDGLGAGAFFAGPFSLEVGSTLDETTAIGDGIVISSSLVDNGDLTRTLTISWFAETGLLPPGTTLADGIIDTVTFETGTANVADDPFFDPDFLGIDSATFTLLDTSGGTLFEGEYFVDVFADGSFGGTTSISAGGADLTGFDIGGGIATITYLVPSPSGLALLGLGGLTAARRRR